MRGLIVKKVQPVYLEEALNKGIEGRVVLKILINREGDVREVTRVSGDPLLAPAAIDAVKQWRYQPYLVSGHPVEVETEALVVFGSASSEGNGTGVAPADEPAPATGVVGSVPGGQPGGIVSSAPSSKPDVPERVRVSPGVSQGLLVTRVAPEYPDEARRGRIQGTVLLTVVIGKTGDVTKIKVVSGHPMLVSAAMDAVQQWKYKPYLLQGNPVEVITSIQVNFALSSH
jgi:TonB family protein